MEKWDPQMMLDLYLHNYLTNKNMHTTAEIFAREANFNPNGVVIEQPEGFLSEWWSIFWSMFSTKFPEHADQENINWPSNFDPAMPSPNFNYIPQYICSTMLQGFTNHAGQSIMQMQEIKNFFVSDNSKMMMPRPDNGNLLGSGISGMMMPRPEHGELLRSVYSGMMMPRPGYGNSIGSNFPRIVMLRPESGNLLVNDLSRAMMPMPGNGHLLGNDFSRMVMLRPESGNLFGGDVSKMTMPRPENENFPGSDITTKNSNLPFMNIDQMVRMMPSSSNPSYQPEKVYKNPQLCLIRDDKCGLRFRRSTDTAGPSNPSPKPHELKFKSQRPKPHELKFKSQPETDSRTPAKNFYINSQPNDPLVRQVPPSINFSHSPQEVHKKPHQLSFKNDEISVPRFCSPAAAEAARFLPKASPAEMEPPAADPRRVREPERSGLPSFDRSTQPLPSGSNFSGPKKNKKQRQLAVTGGKRYGVGLKRSTAAAEPSQPAPRAVIPKKEPADYTDARAFHQVHLGPPPGMELGSYSQPNDIDQLSLLSSSPSIHNTPQQNVSKNNRLPVIQEDDGCNTNLKRATETGPSNPSPKPRELKFKSLLETDFRSPAKNSNMNSQLNCQLVRLVPSSINFSHSPHEKVHKKPHQLSLKNDDKSGTRFCSPATAEAARFLPKARPAKMEPAAAGTDARRVCEPERFGLPSVDRSTQPLPSGSNFSGPKKNKKQRQLAVNGGNRYDVGLKRSTAAEPSQLAPRAVIPKKEPADYTDARAFEQVHLGPPPGIVLGSNTQPNDIDQLPLLLSSTSKHKTSQQNVSKNYKLPVIQEDDGCDTNLERATDTESTLPAPKYMIQPKKEPAETC